MSLQLAGNGPPLIPWIRQTVAVGKSNVLKTNGEPAAVAVQHASVPVGLRPRYRKRCWREFTARFPEEKVRDYRKKNNLNEITRAAGKAA
jgi:hypothetical protein